ncbi:hypothetical protein XM47_01800 [Catenovulum maritimum]|uniref:Uncharacterized protein n=1 Tax=Catenovulum maritimum TaxID=1513271 RepID=A0A0J8H060_9ALTE|nr:hypothetical protein XM47_01800 [Catenovulum maritimum]
MAKNFQSCGISLSLYGGVSVITFIALYGFEILGECRMHDLASTLLIIFLLWLIFWRFSVIFASLNKMKQLMDLHFRFQLLF